MERPDGEPGLALGHLFGLFVRRNLAGLIDGPEHPSRVALRFASSNSITLPEQSKKAEPDDICSLRNILRAKRVAAICLCAG